MFRLKQQANFNDKGVYCVSSSGLNVFELRYENPMNNIMFLPTDKMQMDFIEENQDTESLSNLPQVP